ncbi:MarR family transcriptional regulator [Fictibacillus nanhaiensis]|uniref:MarR family transcriptional regulator n=1 Tax=Fictibacillus nanhaiensis TaxID=742169 RepID=UPI002E24B659|nr:MarR family transcriptional regulator [Fictibacillus nanhaiensis]MED1863202.1 MarR family transcriptional regulator [Fictibacillus nanhaiensis]
MNYNQSQLARMVHEIVLSKMKEELSEISDKYDIPVEDIEKLAISLYVKDVSKSQWKSSNARFIKLYEKEVELLFDNGIINFSEMGFMVFLSLKFTTYEDNTLRNKDGSLCTQKDIIDLSGMTKPTVSRTLKGLIEKKLIFEKKHDQVKNGKKYMISPYIFYKGRLMDRNLKQKFQGLNQLFVDTWKNKLPDNNEIETNENNFEFDTEEFLSLIEKEIVNQHSESLDSNYTYN